MNAQTKTQPQLVTLSQTESILVSMMAIQVDSVLLFHSKLVVILNQYLTFQIFTTASFILASVQEEKQFSCSQQLPFLLPQLCTFQHLLLIIIYAHLWKLFQRRLSALKAWLVSHYWHLVQVLVTYLRLQPLEVMVRVKETSIYKFHYLQERRLIFNRSF